jgi:hypothetical protein
LHYEHLHFTLLEKKENRREEKRDGEGEERDQKKILVYNQYFLQVDQAIGIILTLAKI